MVNLQSSFSTPITHTKLVKYAGASGDFNPIHTVVPIAQEAQLGDVIAHGMLIMGIAGRAITEWFPRENLRLFKVRFSAMTRPGEVVTAQGKIVEKFERNSEQMLRGEVVIVNETGEKKLIGEFEFTQ